MDKRLFYISLIVLFLLLGCSPKQEEDKVPDNSSNNKETPYFAVISKGWQHEFWQAVKMGAFNAAKDYNVKITFEGPEGDFAVAQQIGMVEEAIKRNPSAIIIAATDSNLITPILEKAKDKGIKIIAFDSGVDENIPLTTVATNNIEAASLAADKLANAIDKKGEVAVLCHDENSITGKNRKDGFVNRMKEKYPDIKIVAVKYGSGDHKITYDLASEIIQKYPHLKGIFATNEGSAIGTINGVIANNKGNKITIVGFDSGLQQKEAIRQGIMLGAVSQDPVMIGYKAVEAAYLSHTGKKLPASILTDYIWYDINNVDNEKLKVILYD